MARFVDYLCSTDAAGLFPCSGMGQWPLLSAEERKALIDTCVQAAQGRKPILAGVGSDHNIEEVLEVALYAVEKGVDAVVVVTPSFVRREQPVGDEEEAGAELATYDHYPHDGRQRIRDQEILFRYYDRIAAAVAPVHLVVYDPMPELAPQTMGRLVRARPNVKGMKFRETKDMANFAAMVEAVEGRCAILSGSEYVTVETMRAGAVGVVGGGPNVYPDLAARLVEACAEGNWERAAELQREVSEACDLMGQLGGGSLGAKRVLDEVIGVEMEVSNRGAGRQEGSVDPATLAVFERMELAKYRPAQADSP
jgi:4-hydroxy-tetrahydrodipicolinate synthase